MNRARRWSVVMAVVSLGLGVGFGAVNVARPPEARAAQDPPQETRRTGVPRLGIDPAAAPVVAEAAPAPHVLPPPAIQPRDPGEWQGMPVDTALQAVCGEGGVCGLAMACVEGRCGPCTRDGQCGTGEACVLDHCVPRERTECRTRRDCTEPDALCVLSGLSPGVRGNETLRAYCSRPQGGQSEAPEEAEASNRLEPAVKEPMPAPLPSLMRVARGQE